MQTIADRIDHLSIDCMHLSDLQLYHAFSQASTTLWIKTQRRSREQDPARPSLLSLPREIRDLIYEQLYEPDDDELLSVTMASLSLDSEHYYDPSWAQRCSASREKRAISQRVGSSLHRTCWQIYLETLPVLYGRAHLHLPLSNIQHCRSCKKPAQSWSETSDSLAKNPPFYAQWIIRVIIETCSRKQDRSWDGGFIGQLGSGGEETKDFNQWFWNDIISIRKDLERFFPQIKTVELLLDRAMRGGLFECVGLVGDAALGQIGASRQMRTRMHDQPYWAHLIDLKTPSESRRHLLDMIRHFVQAIEAAVPLSQFPDDLHIRCVQISHIDIDRERWAYNETVLNKALDFVSKYKERASERSQMQEFMDTVHVAVELPCKAYSDSNDQDDTFTGCRWCDLYLAQRISESST